jgi:HemY protein
MVRVFLLLLASAAGFWFLADNLKQKGPGFVWIYFDHYSLETSFWFFCLLLIIFVLLLYIAVRLISILSFLAFRAGLLPKKWGENRYQQQRNRGEIAYAERNWTEAVDAFAKAAAKKNYFADALLGARAAIELGDKAQAAHFYELAKASIDVSELSLGLLRLDMAISEKDDGLCKEVISRLQRDFPRNPLLAAKAFVYFCNSYRWQKAANFMALAKKSSLLTAAEFQHYEQDLHLALLKEARYNHDLSLAEKHFKQAKKMAASASQFSIDVYANYLAALLESDDAKADKLFKQLLKEQSFTVLQACLNTLTTSAAIDNKLNSWFDALQAELINFADNTALLELLGKLSQRLNHPEPAINYYEQSLALAFNKDQALALIALCLKEGKQEKAKKYIERLNKQ